MDQRKTIKSFTGLKGLMLILIILYHQFREILPGGQGIFTFLFTTSGYLLMYSYLENRMKPGPFLVKQIKKLWPQVVFLTSVCSLLILIFSWKEFPWYRGQVLSGIFFYNNIYQVLNWNSYFSGTISSPFSHLWSISIQAQFYFFWFLILFGKKSKQKIVNISFLIASLTIVSFLLGIIYCIMNLDKNLILMRPEIRFFSFGLGSLFALYGTIGRGRFGHENKDMAIGVLFVAFISSIFIAQSNIYVVYLENLIISFLSSFLLLYLSRDDNYFSSFLSEPILLFIGKKAFTYYLWQYPILFFIKEFFPVIYQNPILLIGIGTLSVFLFGEMSYSLIEKGNNKKWVLLLSLLTLITFLSYSYLNQEPISKEEILFKTNEEEKKTASPKEKEKSEEIDEEKVKEGKLPYVPSKELATSIEQINARFPQYRLNIDELERLQTQPGFMIGDLLTVQNEEEYIRILPRIQYNGERDRQLYEVTDTIKEVSSSMGNSNTPIILQFGAKADFDTETLEELIKLADGQRVILINVVTTEPWEDSVNRKLADTAEKNENVFLVDWYEVAKNQSDFFVEDTAEIRPAGKRLMTQMLAHTLLNTAVDRENIDLEKSE